GKGRPGISEKYAACIIELILSIDADKWQVHQGAWNMAAGCLPLTFRIDIEIQYTHQMQNTVLWRNNETNCLPAWDAGQPERCHLICGCLSELEADH
ncbi:MAG: hypothetical protein ACOCPN_01340, partial [Desulfonatronovibrionaceae bacterium]